MNISTQDIIAAVTDCYGSECGADVALILK